MLNPNSLKPIYVQIAEWTEDEILSGKLKSGDKVFSQNEYAQFFSINAITAARGIDVLEEKGILEKRRGVGMFVTGDAKSIILKFRKEETLNEIIEDLWTESRKLGIGKEELMKMIKSKGEQD